MKQRASQHAQTVLWSVASTCCCSRVSTLPWPGPRGPAAGGMRGGQLSGMQGEPGGAALQVKKLLEETA